jgi:LuxR family transcriptional regulator, maltose regulon positive regulatory protein
MEGNSLLGWETIIMGRAARPKRHPRSWDGSSLELVESKLHPPPARPGIVARTGLVDRLLASDGVPVVGVVAPVGYGKTTLLAQWAQRTGRRVGWVSVDQRDNDPAVLLTYIAVALDRVEPLDPMVVRGLAAPGASILGAVARLAAAMAAITQPVALVLDHLELLENQACLDVVAELAAQLPAGAQLLVASRTAPPLPVALLRAQGRVLELGVEDLAMDDQEARALLEGAGVGLDDAAVNELLARTEGWPVGLYLAALAHKAGGPRAHAWAGFTGDDRFMADYLRSEVLGKLPPELLSFLTRTAVLDRMSGPLCDAVLETTGSSAVLAGLEGSNLLLVPLDRQRRWYRYHHLFQELLTAELGRREPGLVPGLHARAASWCEANGLPETAIDHAQAAGDPDRVARLVWELAMPAYGAGRATPPAAGLAGSKTRGCWDATGRWPCSGPGCRPWSVSRSRPSAGRMWPNRGRLPGRSRTAAPRRAICRCCGRCCAATAWTGCGPTPRPPWPS